MAFKVDSNFYQLFHQYVPNRQPYYVARNLVFKPKDTIHEDDFISWLGANKVTHSKHVILSDVAGSGKRSLLARIANELSQVDNTLVVYQSAVEALSNFYQNLANDSETLVIKLLSNYVFKNNEPTPDLHQQLQELIKSRNVNVEWMMDGFEKIQPFKTNQFLSSLKTVMSSFPNFRLWITTRSYPYKNLEKTLGGVVISLVPFDIKSQIEYLVKYWTHSNPDLQQNKVFSFAERILKELKAIETDNEQIDIFSTNIPLNCQLVAEYYQNHVNNYFDDNILTMSPPSPPNISQLYSFLMERKLEVAVTKYNWINWNRDEFYTLHANHALGHFSPASVQKLSLSHLDENSVQILRYSGVLDGDSENLLFSHRIFAEYFFAWYIFNRINEDATVELLVTCALQIHDPNDIRDYWDSDNVQDFRKQIYFKNIGVSNFLNHFLSSVDFTPDNQVSPVLTKYDHTFKIDCISTCIFKNLWHILKIWGMSNFQNLYQINGDINTADHLFNTIEYCDLEAIQLAIGTLFTEGETLSLDHVLFQKETLLHTTIRRGNFTIFSYVFIHGNFSSYVESDNHNLIHACVADSYHLEDHIIDERIDIIDYLHKKSISCIHQKNDKGLVPFLTENIHQRLLIKLIDIKSNLLEAPKGETILHTHTNLTPEEYHNLIVQISVDDLKKLVNVRGKNKQTPLHRAIQDMDLLTPTLNILVAHGADPNCVDSFSESVLGTAIKNKRKLELLQGLKQDDSQVYYINPNKRCTLLHVAAQVGNVEAVNFLLNEKDKILTDFLLSALDHQNYTAADYALVSQPTNQKVIFEMLIAKGVHFISQLSDISDINFNTFVLYKKHKQVLYEDEYSEFLNIFTVFSSKRDRDDHKDFMKTKDLSSLEQIKDKDRQQKLVLKYVGNAIKTGDCSSLENIMALYHEDLAKIEMDYTLLHFAVKCGHYPIVQYLLQPEHFKDCISECRMKNLIHCCVAESAGGPLQRVADKQQIVKLLCNLKAKLVFEAGKNIPWIGPPQAILVPNVHSKLLKCLIENGANIWETDFGNENSKFCFLHRAACLPPTQFHDILEFLDPTEAKLLLTFENSNGQTPVHYALQQTVEVTGEEEYLSKHIPIEIPDKTLILLKNLGVRFDSSHMDTATKAGHSKEFIQKLEKMVNREKERINKQVIFDPNNRGYVTDLISLGRNFNEKDKNGCAPIHNVFQMATNHSFSDVGVDLVRQNVITLIQHGADVNIANGTGHTPMHLTLINKPEKYMTLLHELVTAGGDITAVDMEQRNLLHLASIHYVGGSYHEVVSYIMSINPTLINGRDIYGCSPLHYGVLPIFKQGQDDGHLSTLQLFFDHRVDINATDNDGNTALMYAVSVMEDVYPSQVNVVKQPNIAEVLIKRRANIYLKNINNVSVLHVAVYKGNIDIIEYLLSVGIRDNPSDIDGNTPLHWVFIDKANAERLICSHMHMYTETKRPKFKSSFLFFPTRPVEEKLRVLLQYKPNVNCRNNNNDTPMHLAKKLGLLRYKSPVYQEFQTCGVDTTTIASYEKPN